MTKAKSKLPKELTRKQQSRAEREAQQQRYLLIGVAVVSVITVGLLLLGIYNVRVLQPRQPVAKVGNVDITTEAFQKRVRYQYYNLMSRRAQLQQQRVQFGEDPSLEFLVTQIDQQIAQVESQLSNSSLVGQQVLDAMVGEELIRQEALRRNIAVSPAEVTQFIEQNMFDYYRIPPTPAPTSTPLPTPSVPLTVTPEPTFTPAPSPTPVSEAAFNTAFNNYKSTLSQQAGMTESDFRSLVEAELLRGKVQEAFGAETPTEADQIKLRYVRLESEPAVQVASSFLPNGFNRFYAEVESGKVVSATQGETDWSPVQEVSQQFDPLVWEQLASLAVSQTTKIITNVFGSSYVFQVTGRQVYPLTEPQRQTMQETQFDDWLTAQRNTAGLVTYLDYASVIPPFTQ